MRPYSVWLLAAVAVAGGELAAQEAAPLYSRVAALSGWELRGYHFSAGLPVRSTAQWHVPVVVVAPLGRRMSLDLTTHFASANVSTYGGESESLTGATDSQLRLLYTLGRDRAVASISVNLPTGRRSVSTSEFQVAGAVGSNYLSFPVSNFGTAFGVTAGLAYARALGAWNAGFSGSVRYLGSYEPFSDRAVAYNPGIALRVRTGVDRLVGERARILLGLTVSSFGTDEFTGTGTTTTATYKAGVRFIGELGVVRLIGRSTVTLSIWDFHRFVGDTNRAASPDTKENVLNAELRVGHPVTPRLALEPFAAFRQWGPAGYVGGRLYSGGLAARWSASERLTASLSGRLDQGWVISAGRGYADLTGYGLALFLRYRR